MAKANVVTIEHLEINKRNLTLLKKAFKVTDNAEAVNCAINAISENLELKRIIEKHKGVEIKAVYD